MASSMGHLCSVCIAASIVHKRHILALKREIIETSQPKCTQNLQGQTLRNNKPLTHRERHTQTHNWEVQQDRRVVKAFIFWLKEKDPPDIPEGTDQSQPDWFKLFVLDSTSITIRWSSMSNYSTEEKREHFQLGHGEIDSHHLIYSARLITQAFFFLPNAVRAKTYPRT